MGLGPSKIEYQTYLVRRIGADEGRGDDICREEGRLSQSLLRRDGRRGRQSLFRGDGRRGGQGLFVGDRRRLRAHVLRRDGRCLRADIFRGIGRSLRPDLFRCDDRRDGRQSRVGVWRAGAGGQGYEFLLTGDAERTGSYRSKQRFASGSV